MGSVDGYKFSRDLNRYLVLGRRRDFFAKIRLFMYTPGLWVLFFFRIGQPLNEAGKRSILLKPLAVVYNYLYFLLNCCVGIDLPIDTRVGGGFYIGHHGGIVIHPKTIIGENCNISQGVTIGESGRGDDRGVPVIGDRVYIAPGAKIFGKITVGNDAAVGANAVVNKSIADMEVVGGVPAKVLHARGSGDFVVI